VRALATTLLVGGSSLGSRRDLSIEHQVDPRRSLYLFLPFVGADLDSLEAAAAGLCIRLHYVVRALITTPFVGGSREPEESGETFLNWHVMRRKKVSLSCLLGGSKMRGLVTLKSSNPQISTRQLHPLPHPRPGLGQRKTAR